MEELLSKYPAVLDVNTVAKILSVTPATVRRLTREDKLPYIKVGRLTRIPKNRLIAYLENAPEERNLFREG